MVKMVFFMPFEDTKGILNIEQGTRNVEVFEYLLLQFKNVQCSTFNFNEQKKDRLIAQQISFQ